MKLQGLYYDMVTAQVGCTNQHITLYYNCILYLYRHMVEWMMHFWHYNHLLRKFLQKRNLLFFACTLGRRVISLVVRFQRKVKEKRQRVKSTRKRLGFKCLFVRHLMYPFVFTPPFNSIHLFIFYFIIARRMGQRFKGSFTWSYYCTQC